MSSSRASISGPDWQRHGDAGDVVFGEQRGVSFIPPHLVQGIVDEARVTHIHDEWTKKKFDEGKYKSTDVYSRPRDPGLLKEYQDYLKEKLGAQAYEEYMKRPQPGPRRRPRGVAGGFSPSRAERKKGKRL